ncbi:Hypothetical protein, putative, partial [Bodo saltans]
SAWVNGTGHASFVTNAVTAGAPQATALAVVAASPDPLLSLLANGELVVVNDTSLLESVFATPRWASHVLGFAAANVAFDGQSAATGLVVTSEANESVTLRHVACDEQLVQLLTGTAPSTLTASHCYLDEDSNIFTLNVSGGVSPSIAAAANGVPFFTTSSPTSAELVFNASALMSSLIAAHFIASGAALPALAPISCANAVMRPVTGVFCSPGSGGAFTTLALGLAAQAATLWSGSSASSATSGQHAAWSAVEGEQPGTLILLNSSGFLRAFGGELGLSGASGCGQITVDANGTLLSVSCGGGKSASLSTTLCDSTIAPLVQAAVNGANGTTANATKCLLDRVAVIPLRVVVAADAVGSLSVSATTTGSDGAVHESTTHAPLVANGSILTGAYITAQRSVFPVAAAVIGGDNTTAIDCSLAVAQDVPASTYCGSGVPSTVGGRNVSAYWTFVNVSGQNEGGVVVTSVDQASGAVAASSASAARGSFRLAVLPGFNGLVVNQTWFWATFGSAFTGLAPWENAAIANGALTLVANGGADHLSFTSSRCDPCLTAALNGTLSGNGGGALCPACFSGVDNRTGHSFTSRFTISTLASKLTVLFNFGATSLSVALASLPGDARVYDWHTLSLLTLSSNGRASTLVPEVCVAPIYANTTMCWSADSGSHVTTLVFTADGRTYGGKVLSGGAGGPVVLANVSVDEPLFPVDPNTRDVANSTTFVRELYAVLPDALQSAVSAGANVEVHLAESGDALTVSVLAPGTPMNVTLSASQCDACAAAILGGAFTEGPSPAPCEYCWLSTTNTVLQQTLTVGSALQAVLGLLSPSGELENHTATDAEVPLGSADAFPVVANETTIGAFLTAATLGPATAAAFFTAGRIRGSRGACELPTRVWSVSWCASRDGYFASAWVNGTGYASFVTNAVTAGAPQATALAVVAASPDPLLSLLANGELVVVNDTSLLESVFATPRWASHVLGFAAANVAFDGQSAATGLVVTSEANESVTLRHVACDEQLVQLLTGTAPSTLTASHCYLDEDSNIFTLNVSGGVSPSIAAAANGVPFFTTSSPTSAELVFNASALMSSLIAAHFIASGAALPALAPISCANAVMRPVTGVFCSPGSGGAFTTLALGLAAQAATLWSGSSASSATSGQHAAWSAVEGEQPGTLILLNSSGFLRAFGGELGLSGASGCGQITVDANGTLLSVSCGGGKSASLSTTLCDSTISPLVQAAVDGANGTTANATKCLLDRVA